MTAVKLIQNLTTTMASVFTSSASSTAKKDADAGYVSADEGDHRLSRSATGCVSVMPAARFKDEETGSAAEPISPVSTTASAASSERSMKATQESSTSKSKAGSSGSSGSSAGTFALRPILPREEQVKWFRKFRPCHAASKKTVDADFRRQNQPYCSMNQDLYWGPSTIPACGNGVFSQTSYKKGDTIEIGPCLIDADKNWKPAKETAVHEYYTIEMQAEYSHWRKTLPPYVGKGQCSALMLGYGSLANHSETPNMEVYFGACNTFMMIATRDIEAHEELFIDYGNEYWTEDCVVDKVDHEDPKAVKSSKGKTKTTKASKSSSKTSKASKAASKPASKAKKTAMKKPSKKAVKK